MEELLRWLEMQGFLRMVSLLWATGPNGKHLKVVRNARISQNGFIVMGNRLKWKKFEGGEKCKNFSKWFHCNWQAAHMEDEKGFQRGLIIMGDLPGRKDKMSEREDMIGLDGERGLKSTLERT